MLTIMAQRPSRAQGLHSRPPGATYTAVKIPEATGAGFPTQTLCWSRNQRTIHCNACTVHTNFFVDSRCHGGNTDQYSPSGGSRPHSPCWMMVWWCIALGVWTILIKCKLGNQKRNENVSFLTNSLLESETCFWSGNYLFQTLAFCHIIWGA